jgi:acyl-coenzyme A thioesterase PaaI-like protein
MADAGDEANLELANALREMARALLDHEVEAEAARRAIADLRSARAQLGGPTRPRWYERQGPDAQAVGSEGLPSTASVFDTLSPVRGQLNAVSPPLTMEMAEREDGSLFVLGQARLSRVYEGPPRGVHGGWVAALFDEMLGATMVLAPPPGVTAKLSVDYRHLTPLDEDLRLEAWISETRGRRVQAEATCHAGETLTATASALFVRVDFEQVEARMRARGSD